MDNHRIGLRAYDIQGGIKDLSSGAIEAHMRLTKRVGMVLRLALHIRGPDNYVIDEQENLITLAGELGIVYDSIMPTLRILEELEYCRVFGKIDNVPSSWKSVCLSTRTVMRTWANTGGTTVQRRSSKRA